MSSVKFNIRPDIELYEMEISGSTVDVLEIKNKPFKPYYLYEPYPSNKNLEENKDSKTVRIGNIYSRSGSKNTAIDKTEKDIKVEAMYKERLGLNLTVQNRLKFLLRDIKSWTMNLDKNDNFILHHNLFPEFTFEPFLSEHTISEKNEYSPSWSNVNEELEVHRVEYIFKYHNTCIEKINLFSCAEETEGAYIGVIPEKFMKSVEVENYKGLVESFYYIEESLNYLTDLMLEHTIEDFRTSCVMPQTFPAFNGVSRMEDRSPPPCNMWSYRANIL